MDITFFLFIIFKVNACLTSIALFQSSLTMLKFWHILFKKKESLSHLKFNSMFHGYSFSSSFSMNLRVATNVIILWYFVTKKNNNIFLFVAKKCFYLFINYEVPLNIHLLESHECFSFMNIYFPYEYFILFMNVFHKANKVYLHQ